MFNPSDKTTMGGNEKFKTTLWHEIDLYQNPDLEDSVRQVVIEQLLRRYWKPIYVHLRHKGYDNEQAKDLTQEFFCDIVLRRDIVRSADRSKGRFRTLLLTALDRFVASQQRKETAQKRRPKASVVALDAFEYTPELPAELVGAAPEDLFSYTWACELLDSVIDDVRDFCLATDKGRHWDVFQRKILAPLLGDEPSPALKELCQEYDLDSESTASNMILTVKRIFRKQLKKALRQQVVSGSQADDELTDLWLILSKNRAR